MATKDVTDEELVNEINEIAENLGKDNISYNDYAIHSDLTGDPKDRFGTWNEAKREAGLEVHHPNNPFSREDKLEALRSLDRSDKLNTIRNLADMLETHPHTIKDFYELCDEEGIEPYQRSNMSDEAINSRVEEIVLNNDVVRINDLIDVAKKDKLESLGWSIKQIQDKNLEKFAEFVYENTDRGYHAYRDITQKIREEFGVGLNNHYSSEDLVEKINENYDIDVEHHRTQGQTVKLFIRDGTYDNESRYRRVMREKFEEHKEKIGLDTEFGEDKLFEILIKKLGEGKSFSTVFAGIAYKYSPEEEYTQRGLANEFDVSEVAIRNNYQQLPELK